ncbi:MAG: GGDEF domain-containing protein [Pararhodobacter sp.]|nr:GGDEF domain-containing protein [Pararhodobacter sp.]
MNEPSITPEAATPPFVSDFLRPLRGLLLVVLDTDGGLVDANRGFLDLLGNATIASATPAQMRAVFINPMLGEILARAATAENGSVIYSGRITLGAQGESESWLGQVSYRDRFILVVCEPDIDEERRLRRQLFELIDEYAAQERELARSRREIARHAAQMEQQALTDQLTGLPNRRQLDALMRSHFELAQRSGQPLATIMLDLDHFKRVNDTWGHPEGDRMLQVVATVLQANARAGDVVARWGGEEFSVLAPNTGFEGAVALAERLREAIEGMDPPKGLPTITVSAGVAVLQSGESIMDLSSRVDRALYQAKNEGRNRVVCLDEKA